MKLKLGVLLFGKVNAGSPEGNDGGFEKVLIQMTGNDVPFEQKVIWEITVLYGH